MTMHSTQTLYDELRGTLAQIDQQIYIVKTSSQADIDNGMYQPDTTVYHLRDKNGQYLLVPLLTIRANTLIAMAQLKAGSMAQRGGPGRGKW